MSHRASSYRTRPSGALAAGVAALLLAAPASGQSEPAQLRARVVDEGTGMPLAGALIESTHPRASLLTDSAGLFVLRGEPGPGGYALLVDHLGYRRTAVSLPVRADSRASTIELTPDPVALEDLQVLVDRFKTRRRAYWGLSRVIDERRLVRAGGSAWDVVRQEVPSLSQCPRAVDALCVLRRGRRATVSLCVDEWRAYPSDLEAYAPQELYLVEIFDRGLQVRLYTRRFVESKLERGRGLQPLEWGCI